MSNKSEIQGATIQELAEDSLKDSTRCPKCGGELEAGYLLSGGIWPIRWNQSASRTTRFEGVPLTEPEPKYADS